MYLLADAPRLELAGRLSRAGSIKNDNVCVVGLIGGLWNHDLQTRLQRIHRHVARQAAAPEPPAKPSGPQFRRRRAGTIQKAIAAVLADQREGIRVRDIAEAVTALLGEQIPLSSVKSCLWREAQSSTGRFERIGRGRYRLRSASG
jgi:hypothetical protein